MTIAENKDPFAPKDAVLMAPVFATSIAISWEVGKFTVTGGFFFFSLSEHLVSAISALPIALAVALLALVAASGTMKAPHESTATWTKKRKDWIFLLVAFLALVVAIVGTWITSSLFMAALGTIAALMAIVFGRLALRRSDTFSLLCFVLMGTFLPFAAAYDFTKVSLDSPKEAQSTIKLKSGPLYGVIFMAGERGILVFKRDTRTFLFLRADEVLNIEYMMPRTEPPPWLFNQRDRGSFSVPVFFWGVLCMILIRPISIAAIRRQWRYIGRYRRACRPSKRA
jgi:hypothetical protein